MKSCVMIFCSLLIFTILFAGFVSADKEYFGVSADEDKYKEYPGSGEDFLFIDGIGYDTENVSSYDYTLVKADNCSVIPIGEEYIDLENNISHLEGGISYTYNHTWININFAKIFWGRYSRTAFEGNLCESNKILRVRKCIDNGTVKELKNTFDITECGTKEICFEDKCIEQTCPAKIHLESEGKIIAPDHYPAIFIKTYDSENNAIESIISYTAYINSEVREKDILLEIPQEGLKIIKGDDLKEFIEQNTDPASYKMVFSGSPLSLYGCETEEKVFEFTIKDSMTIFDKIAEFFRLVF